MIGFIVGVAVGFIFYPVITILIKNLKDSAGK